jgi:hypothetical protein
MLATRGEILQLKANQGPHWTSFIVAHYINGKLDTALQAVTA